MAETKPLFEPEAYEERLDRFVDEYRKMIVARLDEQYTHSASRADKIADKVATFGGSWKFIILFGCFLAAWMIVNVLALTRVIHFDEPPFILLNLILSFIAAFQAPLILMSQNRQAQRDKNEALIDFSINFKAEREVDDIQGHLHRLEDNFASFRDEMRNELAAIKTLLTK
ncbi:DUF1003 domain-containing protein [Paenibacillus cymbidii]|uniref:DUF1003 domain-containing protein n=1 Tax=Paenibacillus cymbidii TaxID=1639034 RepID=UPI001081B6B2|nr:DUF1003 domain-containing protein [Paenibacillus cymbidii]